MVRQFNDSTVTRHAQLRLILSVLSRDSEIDRYGFHTELPTRVTWPYNALFAIVTLNKSGPPDYSSLSERFGRIGNDKRPSDRPALGHPRACNGFTSRLQWKSRTQSVPRQFDVVIERDTEGYYVASVPQIPGCHTQAQSLDDVTQRIREAIELCLEVEGAPEHDLEFVGIQRVTIAA